MSKKINFRASDDILLFQFMKSFVHQTDSNEFYYDGTCVDMNPGVMVDFSLEHSYEIFNDNIIGRYWGGWNACPTGAEMYVVARRWEEKFAAEIVDIGHDSLDFILNQKLDDEEIDLLIEEIKNINAELNYDGEFEEFKKHINIDLRFSLWWD